MISYLTYTKDPQYKFGPGIYEGGGAKRVMCFEVPEKRDGEEKEGSGEGGKAGKARETTWQERIGELKGRGKKQAKKPEKGNTDVDKGKAQEYTGPYMQEVNGYWMIYKSDDPSPRKIEKSSDGSKKAVEVNEYEKMGKGNEDVDEKRKALEKEKRGPYEHENDLAVIHESDGPGPTSLKSSRTEKIRESGEVNDSQVGKMGKENENSGKSVDED